MSSIAWTPTIAEVDAATIPQSVRIGRTLPQDEHNARSARIVALARQMCIDDNGRPDRLGKGHDDDPQWFHYYGDAMLIIDGEAK